MRIHSRRMIRWSLVQIVCIGVFVLIYSMWISRNTAFLSERNVIRKFPNLHFRKKNIKQILMWLPHIGNIDSENACLKECSVKCVVTGDKNDIKNVDAVDFHLSNLWTEIQQHWDAIDYQISDLPPTRSNMDCFELGTSTTFLG